MSPTKVAILGAKGRMGSTTAEAIRSAPDLELVAELDVETTEPAAAAKEAGASVVVDFTLPGVVVENVHALIDAGLNVVVGTTGWNPESLSKVVDHLAQANAARPANAQLGVLIAPNFALSAVLALRFAALAAPFFESAEVIELHHPNKVDAPSGTAKTTATNIAAARAEAGLGEMPDATESGVEARGLKVDGIPVHAVRLRGLVAHE